MSFCDVIPRPNGFRYPERAFSWRIKMEQDRGRTSESKTPQGQALIVCRRVSKSWIRYGVSSSREPSRCVGGLNGFEKKKKLERIGWFLAPDGNHYT